MFANLRNVIQASLVSPREVPELESSLLDEGRVRDQLSAAEELHYLGHAEPALVAAGAALAGVLRLRAGLLVGHSASCEALLAAVHATGALSVSEHELLCRLLRAHDRLTRGYAPNRFAALATDEAGAALAMMVNMLERLRVSGIDRRHSPT